MIAHLLLGPVVGAVIAGGIHWLRGRGTRAEDGA